MSHHSSLQDNIIALLLLDIRGDGYALTPASRGVVFDVDGDGKSERVGWPPRV